MTTTQTATATLVRGNHNGATVDLTVYRDGSGCAGLAWYGGYKFRFASDGTVESLGAWSRTRAFRAAKAAVTQAAAVALGLAK